MATEPYKFWRIFILLYIFGFNLINGDTAANLKPSLKNDSKMGLANGRALFSPRVDYNEWMPVGRADPLKNDPTYDYSPPVLDRVRYWGDTNKDKNEILLLGIPSRRHTHKKDNKMNNIRRNFYTDLPTKLMPPPLQNLTPTNRPIYTTEKFKNFYNYNNYNRPKYNWRYSNQIDSHPDESNNYINFYSQGTTVVPQKKPWIHELLQKELTKSQTIVMPSYNTVYDTQTTFETTNSPSTTVKLISASPLQTKYIPATSSLVSPTTTPIYSYSTATPTPTDITTDSLFSHYKQPSKLINGPMYVIIQGHSKVKTYGPKDNMTKDHSPKIVPVPVKEDNVVQHVVSKTGLVKHLHKKSEILNNTSTNTTESNEESGGVENLLSLFESSFGNFFIENDETEQGDTIEKKNTNKFERNRKIRQVFDYDQLPEEFEGDFNNQNTKLNRTSLSELTAQ